MVDFVKQVEKGHVGTNSGDSGNVEANDNLNRAAIKH